MLAGVTNRDQNRDVAAGRERAGQGFDRNRRLGASRLEPATAGRPGLGAVNPLGHARGFPPQPVRPIVSAPPGARPMMEREAVRVVPVVFGSSERIGRIEEARKPVLRPLPTPRDRAHLWVDIDEVDTLLDRPRNSDRFVSTGNRSSRRRRPHRHRTQNESELLHNFSAARAALSVEQCFTKHLARLWVAPT